MASQSASTFRTPEIQRQFTGGTEDVRMRALCRLYERRTAVDNLIHALERYQEKSLRSPAKRPPLSVAATWK
jgi:hypothetical protein